MQEAKKSFYFDPSKMSGGGFINPDPEKARKFKISGQAPLARNHRRFIKNDLVVN